MKKLTTFLNIKEFEDTVNKITNLECQLIEKDFRIRSLEYELHLSKVMYQYLEEFSKKMISLC